MLSGRVGEPRSARLVQLAHWSCESESKYFKQRRLLVPGNDDSDAASTGVWSLSGAQGARVDFAPRSLSSRMRH